MGVDIPSPSGSATPIESRKSGSSESRIQSGSEESSIRLPPHRVWEPPSPRIFTFPAMCVPLSQITWRHDGTLHFDKKSTRIIKQMVDDAEAARKVDQDIPVPDQQPRRCSSLLEKLSGVRCRSQDQDQSHKQDQKVRRSSSLLAKLASLRRGSQDQDQSYKNIGEDYHIPKWGKKRPRVGISLWIPELHLSEDCLDWDGRGGLTIRGNSAMIVLTKSAMVIDKDECILNNIPALSMWPRYGVIAANGEEGDFNISMNHLQRGRCVWVSRKKGWKSVIDISRTEKLWDARTLIFDSHNNLGAHMPILGFCYGNDLFNWPAARKDGPTMARGRLGGALQELVERGDEKDCEGWLEVKTQLEQIVRKRMVDRNKSKYFEPCDRCTRISRPIERASSLEDDFMPEPSALEIHDPAGQEVPPMKKGTKLHENFVDRDTKRKNKAICFRGCTRKACRTDCGIDPNKTWYTSRSTFKLLLKSLFKSEPESELQSEHEFESESESESKSGEDTEDEEEKETVDKIDFMETQRLPYCPHNWEMHFNTSIECNEPSWKGFKCTETKAHCPGTFPECPHALFKKYGESANPDSPFKWFYIAKGRILWKGLEVPQFKADTGKSDEENARRLLAFRADMQRRYDEFKNPPAEKKAGTSSSEASSSNQPQSTEQTTGNTSPSTPSPAEAAKSTDAAPATFETLRSPSLEKANPVDSLFNFEVDVAQPSQDILPGAVISADSPSSTQAVTTEESPQDSAYTTKPNQTLDVSS